MKIRYMLLLLLATIKFSVAADYSFGSIATGGYYLCQDSWQIVDTIHSPAYDGILDSAVLDANANYGDGSDTLSFSIFLASDSSQVDTTNSFLVSKTIGDSNHTAYFQFGGAITASAKYLIGPRIAANADTDCKVANAGTGDHSWWYMTGQTQNPAIFSATGGKFTAAAMTVTIWYHDAGGENHSFGRIRRMMQQ